MESYKYSEILMMDKSAALEEFHLRNSVACRIASRLRGILVWKLSITNTIHNSGVFEQSSL